MKIIIYEEPIAKARARTFIRKSKSCTIDPQHFQKQETKFLIKRAVNQLYDSSDTSRKKQINDLLKGNVFRVFMNFYMSIPNSCVESKRNEIMWGFKQHTQSDLDNLIKFISDCANGVLWEDDRMIISIIAKKHYSKKPRTEIEIMEIVEPNQEKLSDVDRKIFTTYNPQDIKNLFNLVLELSQFIDFHKSYDDQDCFEEFDLIKISELMQKISIEHADKLKKVKKYSDGKITC